LRCPPAGDHSWRYVGEQARRQPDGPDGRELGDLGQQGVEANVAGVGLDPGQHVRMIVVGIVLNGNQRLEPGDGTGVEAPDDPRQ
jgi:hypothetical protein